MSNTRIHFKHTLTRVCISSRHSRLDSLKEVHRARQAELSRMQGDVDSAKTSVEALEETSSESQLNFYRSMTLYTHNLVECLREKVRP